MTDVPQDRWFKNHRVEWVCTMVQVYGFIRRHHLETMFGVSTPQASHDLQTAIKRWPSLMFYDASAKMYKVNPNLKIEPGRLAE